MTSKRIKLEFYGSMSIKFVIISLSHGSNGSYGTQSGDTDRRDVAKSEGARQYIKIKVKKGHSNKNLVSQLSGM